MGVSVTSAAHSSPQWASQKIEAILHIFATHRKIVFFVADTSKSESFASLFILRGIHDLIS